MNEQLNDENLSEIDMLYKSFEPTAILPGRIYIHRYEAAIRDVVEGVDMDSSEYQDMLRSRDFIQYGIEKGSTKLSEALRAWISSADDLFRNATTALNTSYLYRTNASDNWYAFRVPLNPGTSIKIDIEFRKLI